MLTRRLLASYNKCISVAIATGAMPGPFLCLITPLCSYYAGFCMGGCMTEPI
jgi:hypothetical protein